MQWNKTQQRKSPKWQLSKEYRDVNDLFMQSFIGQTIYMITNLKREMPKYKASQVRNNVILIILIELQVFQPVYTYLIRILQSIKTIVKYVIPRFLFKPLYL